MEGTETVKARVGEGREPCVVGPIRSTRHGIHARLFTSRGLTARVM